jgi:hypothetical protein
MAKKTDPAFSKSRPKDKYGLPTPGWKQCFKCQGWNKGARRKECLACNAPFPEATTKAKAKAKAKAKVKATVNSEAPAVNSDIIEWIKAAGGWTNAEAILTQVNGVEIFGGVSQVRKVLGWVQSVGGSVGGIEKVEAVFAEAEKVRALGGVYVVTRVIAQWQAIRNLPN